MAGAEGVVGEVELAPRGAKAAAVAADADADADGPTGVEGETVEAEVVGRPAEPCPCRRTRGGEGGGTVNSHTPARNTMIHHAFGYNAIDYTQRMSGLGKADVTHERFLAR